MQELFEPRLGGTGRSWRAVMPPDCFELACQLADEIIKRGTEPSSWEQVRLMFLERWPDTTPKQKSVVTRTIRDLVAERSNA